MNPREGEDYYLERGLLVFTAAYHRKRGYCCGSGCRHCPYWPPHSGSAELAPDGMDAAQRRSSIEPSGGESGSRPATQPPPRPERLKPPE